MPEKLDKAFDQLMQEKFRDFKAEPAVGLWNKISAGLNKPAKKRLPFTWLAAAVVFIFSAIGLWLNNSSPITENQYMEEAVVQKPEPTLSMEDTPENAAISIVATTHAAPKKAKYNAQNTKVNKNTALQVAADVQTKADPISVETPVSPPEPVLIADPFPNLNDAAPAQLNAANVVDESETSAQDEPLSRQRGGSIGRFVNKLVAKVDSREDKLIEVSEEAGEGLRITGLNFGLVKMKNKNAK